jgi:hypothetical protein
MPRCRSLRGLPWLPSLLSTPTEKGPTRVTAMGGSASTAISIDMPSPHCTYGLDPPPFGPPLAMTAAVKPPIGGRAACSMSPGEGGCAQASRWKADPDRTPAAALGLHGRTAFGAAAEPSLRAGSSSAPGEGPAPSGPRTRWCIHHLVAGEPGVRACLRAGTLIPAARRSAV